MKSGRYFFSLASQGELILNINNYVSTNRPLSRTWVSRISLIIPIISEDVIVIWRLSQEIIIIFPGRIYQASNSGSDDDIWSGESVQILISSSRGRTLDYLCCRDMSTHREHGEETFFATKSHNATPKRSFSMIPRPE